MDESGSQAESGGVRPSPALLWTKKSTRKPAADDSGRATSSIVAEQSKQEHKLPPPESLVPASDTQQELEVSESALPTAAPVTENKPKTPKKATRTTSTKVLPFAPKHYVDLSTKARKSVQLAIAELRHFRKKAGRPHTIKHFIEAALTAWKDSPRARLDFVPERIGEAGGMADDPFETFNNVIELELKNAISDICHERGKLGHPVSTMILILDEAFRQWLPLQEDLPKQYLESAIPPKNSGAPEGKGE